MLILTLKIGQSRETNKTDISVGSVKARTDVCDPEPILWDQRLACGFIVELSVNSIYF